MFYDLDQILWPWMEACSTEGVQNFPDPSGDSSASCIMGLSSITVGYCLYRYGGTLVHKLNFLLDSDCKQLDENQIRFPHKVNIKFNIEFDSIFIQLGL